MYPITFGARLICIVHAAFCAFCVATASSVVAFKIGLFVVSPELQIAVSSWHLLGVAAISGALAGISSNEALPVSVYFYYMLVSTLGWGFVAFRLLQAGSECKLVQENFESQRVGLSLACGMVSAAWVSAALLVFSLVSYANYSIYQMKEYLEQRTEAGYLLEQAEHFARGGRYSGAKPLSTALPARGPQPAWGSVTVRSVALP